jgi:hypothetical protein
MTRKVRKDDFPVSQVRRYLEPGPIVLVSSQWQGRTNIMTLGWLRFWSSRRRSSA